MADDCSNNWGCCLTCDVSGPNKQTRYTFQAVSSNGEDASVRELKALIAATFDNKHKLLKVLSCGSDANLFAISVLTEGNNSTCLVAAGSYVAGDGPLRSWSTIAFSIENGPTHITPPGMVTNKFTKSHTVGLPYAIPGVYNESEQTAYEDKCLNALHQRCLLAKLKGEPIKCILMELILASNGASLSDRSLVLIGRLCKFHNIFIVVDECMTGGRTGTMLLVETAPTEFLDRVSHVTLGKWVTAGLVLESQKYHNFVCASNENDEGLPNRGTSSIVGAKAIMKKWSSVLTSIPYTEKKRDKVLQKIRINPAEAWGKGCLIFAPIHKTGLQFGLKNRLLPMLDVNIPLDKFSVTKMPEWSKDKINELVVDGVNNWLQSVPYHDGDEQLYDVAKFLANGHHKRIHKLSTLIETRFQKFNTKTLSEILRKAEAAGLVNHVLIGGKRERRWVVKDSCLPDVISRWTV